MEHSTFIKNEADALSKDFESFLEQEIPMLYKKYTASKSGHSGQPSSLTEEQQEEQRLMDLRIEALGELRRLEMLQDFQKSRQVAQEIVTQQQLRAAQEAFQYASETYRNHVDNHNLPDRTRNTLEIGSKRSAWTNERY